MHAGNTQNSGFPLKSMRELGECLRSWDQSILALSSLKAAGSHQAQITNKVKQERPGWAYSSVLQELGSTCWHLLTRVLQSEFLKMTELTKPNLLTQF